MPPRRIYVGNLPRDVQRSEVMELFERFGKISFADLKGGRTGPPFAFIEFEDYRDAEDAISARDGYKFDGCRLRVEFPKGEMRGRGGAFVGRGRDDFGQRRSFQQRRTQYRVIVSGLPSGASWQDLKDHMRSVAEVCYAEVKKDSTGTGLVEFSDSHDMKQAIRKLDDTEMRSHEGSTAYIRLRESSRSESPGGSNGSRSRSRSRSNSPPPRRRRDSRSSSGERGNRSSRRR